MVRSIALGSMLAAILAAGFARADLAYFAGGGQAQLPATIDGYRVRISTPVGPKVFDRRDFLAIVPGDDPARDWPARSDRATQDGRSGPIFEAWWWALENGLTDEANALLRSSRGLAASSGHAPSLKALAMLDRLDAPCPDRPDLAAIMARLRPSRFLEIRSDHVVLLYQGDEAEAKSRLEVLERVVATFALGFSAHGVEIQAPEHKLISAWFADRRDYVDFLKRSDASPFADTQGFYHPTLRAVFAHDGRSSEGYRGRVRAIGNRRKDGAPAAELARLELLLDLDWRATELGIAAHETVHQMTVASGLARHPEDFPAWLHEGLAAQFEVVRGGRWAGVGRVNDLRMPDWRAIRPAPRLAPLLLDDGFARGYRRDSYAESWALVYFLRKARPLEFLAFLDRLRNPGQGAIPAHDRSLLAFRSAFGDDLVGLERAWWRFLADLQTPLESARPADALAVGPNSRNVD